ncbi:MAG: lipoate--protein ligase family protein, partial [Armatimonadetes bacterium]|nr:lipoate--protein ligase family protein [Armatimonadota bacterium]
LPHPHTALPLLETYRLLSGGLIAGLRRLGLEARLAPGQKAHRGPSGADCFAAAAQCDLVVGGEKICGSAQLRRQGVVLQHGALPLSLPVTASYWREVGPPARATDLSRALGRRPSRDEVTDALAAGFAEALGARLVPGELTDEERALAAELRRERYANDAWNLRR